jgi:hypothetical protein
MAGNLFDDGAQEAKNSLGIWSLNKPVLNLV